MNETTPESSQKSTVDSQSNIEFDSLEHLQAHYQEEYPPEIKWHQNKMVQMLFSISIFAMISFIIVSLLTLFSDQLGVFINSRMIFTAQITDNVLLHSANRLRKGSELLPANERFYLLELAQNLENAANELDVAGQFILKSRNKSAPSWLQMAIAEYTRQNNLGTYNNRILQYVSSINKSINTAAQTNIAWSSHFVNWIMHKANIIGTNNEQPSSWLKWGKPVTKLTHGAIGVFKLEWPHKSEMVGFFLLETKNYDIVLVGDVLSAISVVAFAKEKLLGYRWPNE